MSVVVTVVAPAAPSDAWERWSDVESWPAWNPHCVAAQLRGPLEPGSVLDLQLRHPRGRDFYTRPRITQVIAGREFSWEARGFGLRASTRARFNHDDDGARIDLHAETVGAMAFTYKMTMSERALAVLYTNMLDALVEDLRG